MNRTSMVLLSILLVLVTLHRGWANKQRSEDRRSPFQLVQRATLVDRSGDSITSPHTFSLAGNQYLIHPDGRGQRQSRNRSVQTFKLSIPTNFLVDDLWYGKRYHDLLLICELNNAGWGTSRFMRLDGHQLKPRWISEIPGSKVGPALVEGAHIYVTAVGFIGRLNLNTGHYAWRHSGLYQRYDRHQRKGEHFNAFLLPVVHDKEVVFVERASGGTEQDASGVAVIKAIRVNKRTGRIISLSRLDPSVVSALAKGTHPAYASLKYRPRD